MRGTANERFSPGAIHASEPQLLPSPRTGAGPFITRLELTHRSSSMKHVATLLLISLTLATGTVLAADPTTATKPTATTMDHSKTPTTHTTHAEHAEHAEHQTADAFAALDTNKDGALSKKELAEHPMAAHVSMVDANKDGSLSKSEFAALEGM
jgi:hypothetical protein